MSGYDRRTLGGQRKTLSPNTFPPKVYRKLQLVSLSDFPPKRLHSLFVTWPCWHVRASPGLAVSCQVVSQSVNRAADLKHSIQNSPSPD